MDTHLTNIFFCHYIQKQLQNVENNPFFKWIFRYSILKCDKPTPNVRPTLYGFQNLYTKNKFFHKHHERFIIYHAFSKRLLKVPIIKLFWTYEIQLWGCASNFNIVYILSTIPKRSSPYYYSIGTRYRYDRNLWIISLVF